MFEYYLNNGVAVVHSLGKKISDENEAMDVVLSIKHDSGATKIAFSKSCFDERFFILSSGIAGEVIQKFVNYGIRAAVFGEFSHYTSKPLHDFIYESNNGHHFGFLQTEEDAVRWLTR